MLQEGIVNHIEALAGLELLPDGCIDFVFADLPYAQTQNPWDEIIPFELLWPALKRVCKRNAALVFTATQPFTTTLVMSNRKMFRYELIWRKSRQTGALSAKYQPMRAHEDIEVFYDEPPHENELVFYREQPVYRPQVTKGHQPVHGYHKRHPERGHTYGATKAGLEGGGATERQPISVLDIPSVGNSPGVRIHPQQKPVELPEYFIRTYTDPGDMVLDPTAGSGSTLVAALRNGRRCIGFELDAQYARDANRRLHRERAKLSAG